MSFLLFYLNKAQFSGLNLQLLDILTAKLHANIICFNNPGYHIQSRIVKVQLMKVLSVILKTKHS